MTIAELMSKRAAENKDKIINKQSVKLIRYLMRELRKKIRLGYTSADVYPPAKYLRITHFDETLRVTKGVLEDEGFLLCFNGRTVTRDPYYYIGLIRCSDD